LLKYLKNLTGYTSENNFVGILRMMSDATKSILATSLSVPYNYFDDDPTKLFSDLYMFN